MPALGRQGKGGGRSAAGAEMAAAEQTLRRRLAGRGGFPVKSECALRIQRHAEADLVEPGQRHLRRGVARGRPLFPDSRRLDIVAGIVGHQRVGLVLPGTEIEAGRKKNHQKERQHQPRQDPPRRYCSGILHAFRLSRCHDMVTAIDRRCHRPGDAGWPESVAEARALQQALRDRVIREDRIGPLRRIAGIDVAYARRRNLTWAAVGLLSVPDLLLEESALAALPTRFPYVPGLLSFRETPAVLEALPLLSYRPDLLMVDGHGYAHPRRFGIACHIGVLTDTPTIGVAKSRLVGHHQEPGPNRGDRVPLLDGQEVIGMVVRTRSRVRPIYVSIGHRVSLERAVELVLACGRGFRLPEPTRLADKLSRCHGG